MTRCKLVNQEMINHLIILEDCRVRPCVSLNPMIIPVSLTELIVSALTLIGAEVSTVCQVPRPDPGDVEVGCNRIAIDRWQTITWRLGWAL
jgi:hypothetical protein